PPGVARPTTQRISLNVNRQSAGAETDPRDRRSDGDPWRRSREGTAAGAVLCAVFAGRSDGRRRGTRRRTAVVRNMDARLSDHGTGSEDDWPACLHRGTGGRIHADGAVPTGRTPPAVCPVHSDSLPWN